MFTRILVPLDGSSLAECVLPHVLATARDGQAQIFLLRVLDPSSGDGLQPVDPVEWQILKAGAENYLRDISGRLQTAGLNVSTTVLEGKAAERVIEFSSQNNADLIILSSHGQSGISGWNVSSVVQKIILRVRTSVLIVRAYQPVIDNLEELRYQRILVPLDGSQRAEFVLPTVASIARKNQSQVILVQAIQKPELPRRTPLSPDDHDLITRVIERNRVEATRYLNELSGRLDIPVLTRLLVCERVVSTLHTQVLEEQADIVILSAHGYGGDTRWPYGSVVVSFLAYGTTPLLVMQDLPLDRIEPSAAELAAREYGGR